MDKLRNHRKLFLRRYHEMGHSLKGDETIRQAIRVNTLKSSNLEVQQILESLGVKLCKIPYLDHGYRIESTPFSLGASIEYLLGLFSIQESASQLPVQIMLPTPGEVNLDMSAAPGGKTTQIAAYMKNTSVIYALDVNKERIYSLENNLERCGVENCLVYNVDAALFAYEHKFDKILLDAPCSGNYVVDPEWFDKRSMSDILRNALNQRKLLANAVKLLCEGGLLVYSTCSMEPEEDELNIQWLLENYDVDLDHFEGPGSPGLTIINETELDNRIKNCMRFWPDEAGTQGFFIAKVTKE
jgi:NOL1/NOP2/sun family putative RNA methylase